LPPGGEEKSVITQYIDLQMVTKYLEKDLVTSSKHADHMQIFQMLNFVDMVKIIAEKFVSMKIKPYLCIRFNKSNK